MKVRLRKKTISKGRKSLYLDIYPPILDPDTSKPRRYKYLELFVYDKPKFDWEKVHNRETMELATHICAKVQLDVQKRRFAFLLGDKNDG